MIAVLLASFILSSAHSEGVSPIVLSGDMRQDWMSHAATAQVCAVDFVPSVNILRSWQKLGVKILKRISWNSEDSAEFLRRRAGALAVYEGADGVWFEDGEGIPERARLALAEAETDANVIRYCKELAERALSWREKNHKVWIEGRRALWLLRFMDFETENLDTIRLEFACYARRLEQLQGMTPQKLPFEVGKALEPDRAKFVPLSGRDRVSVAVTVSDAKTVKIGDALEFCSDTGGFAFTISSKKRFDGDWPGGKGVFRLYLPDQRGSYLPYEFLIDLSPVETKRAPTDAYGLWFLEERWGKGALALYHLQTNWRIKTVSHGSYGSQYPRLCPQFKFTKNADGNGWALSLRFTWLATFGYWPSVRNGMRDAWYVSLDGLTDVSPVACRMDWGAGREANFKKIASALSCSEITQRYAEQKESTSGIYNLWQDERLYGFVKTKEPTYQRCDTDSDRVFWERVVAPMIESNRNLEEITYAAKPTDAKYAPAKLTKETDAVKMLVWKSLGKLFDLSERVSRARRDYILQRRAGGMPVAPVRKGMPSGTSNEVLPDGGTDAVLELDDVEF